MYNKYCDLYNDTCHKESKDISNKLIDDYYVKRSQISGFDTKQEIAE